jgi:hypothetical protein
MDPPHLLNTELYIHFGALFVYCSNRYSHPPAVSKNTHMEDELDEKLKRMRQIAKKRTASDAQAE